MAELHSYYPLDPDASGSVFHDADVDDGGTLGLSLSAYSCFSSLTNHSIDCLNVGDVHLQIPVPAFNELQEAMTG
jgi:hypothetical protein